MLTNRFYYVVTTIEESRELDSMTLNDLQASLESHEMWMNERSPSTPSETLKATTNRTQQNQRISNFRSKDGKSFKPTPRQGERGNESFKDNSHIQCYKCKRHGHFQYECKSHIQCQNCKRFGHYSNECLDKRPKSKYYHAKVV